MTEHVIVVTAEGEQPDGGLRVPELAMIRLLSLLPADWQVRTCVRAAGFELAIAAGLLPPDEVHRRLALAFADAALAGWRWRDGA